jgi:hypothetical protein
MDYSVPGFIRITDIDDLNHLASPTDNIRNNQEIFLRRDGVMIYVGPYREVKRAAGMGGSSIAGIDGTYYGEISDPTINENLFIADNRPRLPPPPGQRNIPTLLTLAKQSLSSDDYDELRQKRLQGEELNEIGFAFPPPNKITYSDGSNQNAGDSKHRRSCSKKFRSRKHRSRKHRSRKHRSRKHRSRRVRHR